MDDHSQPAKRVLFLFSDTGGGHRSAASAIIEALELEFPGGTRCEMVDILKDYGPPPINYAPEIYPPLSRMPHLWELGYRASDGRRRSQMLYQALWPYIRYSLDALMRDYPADLVVSVHQFINAPVARALARRKVPFVTVVTDMVSTHAFWFDPRASLIIVPTEAAKQRGLQMGALAERLRVAGQPVAERFRQPPADRVETRRALGWREDLPVALLVGGGEGMGPLEAVAQAIDHAGLPLTLAMVAGRNRALEKRLKARAWQSLAFIYGFVTNMPDLMRAADILVTKAGPGTISEGFIAGLPQILYSKMPGQEDGNVTYVVDESAGVWAPEPAQVVATLREWLEQPAAMAQFAANSRRLANPDASRQIARLLGGVLGLDV
ncbi:MAG: galactosyldiacylglycerol synthase [Anaerolineae bacterium]|nr:galactosyldiacylglycerol synthase [Anaerolineae bacterium]